jgi:hypothetical protein
LWWGKQYWDRFFSDCYRLSPVSIQPPILTPHSFIYLLPTRHNICNDISPELIIGLIIAPVINKYLYIEQVAVMVIWYLKVYRRRDLLEFKLF